MCKVNINTCCDTQPLTTCYLWKSTRGRRVTMADSPVVLQLSLREEDEEGGRAAQKQAVRCVCVCVNV